MLMDWKYGSVISGVLVNMKYLETRGSDVNCIPSARRTEQDHHNIIDLTAFNTDGFDVSGRNVWIHDCSVWAQDDCIAVKVILL